MERERNCKNCGFSTYSDVRGTYKCLFYIHPTYAELPVKPDDVCEHHQFSHEIVGD